MRHDPQHPNQKGRRHRPLGRTALLAGWLLAVGVLATACSRGSSGPGVAGAGSSSTPTASPSGFRMADALAYSQCMRDHGVSDFPDPDAEGQFKVEGVPGSDLDPDNPQLKHAQESCKSLLPTPSEGEQEQDQARLRYAKCMRAHAFPTFPDPGPDGGFDIDTGAHPELDPDTPRFQEANRECGGPSGADTNTDTGGS
jgi:hypothetical protein